MSLLEKSLDYHYCLIADCPTCMAEGVWSNGWTQNHSVCGVGKWKGSLAPRMVARYPVRAIYFVTNKLQPLSFRV